MSESLKNWLARVPTLFTRAEIAALTAKEVAELEITAGKYWEGYWEGFRADTKRIQDLH